MVMKEGYKMISFKNDYNKLAHPNILNRLINNNIYYYDGYGLDEHCKKAKQLIQKHLQFQTDIHFLIGGTSANKTVISHCLKPYQAVIAVKTGHINVHETGAIEACGHKILTTNGVNGKITCEEIEEIYLKHVDEHMVYPKMVYLSNSTETGSIYSKQELTKISNLCRRLDLYLYLDGARLGVALTSKKNDLSLNDIAMLTDVFYIGGTKNGALLGEAVIITNDLIKPNFRYSLKQNGGMLAKGFLIGIQFEELFTNDLFFRLGEEANQKADYLVKCLNNIGIYPEYESCTNQQFIKLANSTIDKLATKYAFEVWERNENDSIIRLVTSWATNNQDIDCFINDLQNLI